MEDIHWHDCMIDRVVEAPADSELVMEVSYPTDWEKNVFEPRLIVFSHPLEYHVEEGPFRGAPTILSANIEEETGGYRRIVLETNAGRRSLRFRGLELRNEQGPNKAPLGAAR